MEYQSNNNVQQVITQTNSHSCTQTHQEQSHHQMHQIQQSNISHSSQQLNNNNQKQYPIPLIQIQNDQFIISEQAIQFLSNIKKPIAVISIVGKYRTGKSLFLNKVLLNNNNNNQSNMNNNSIFKVCPTINSCTKGLWISSKTIPLEIQGKQVQAIIMDTQGFGAMEQTNHYNNKILLFALLLSSYFIYNSVGSIDQKSLNNLNIIVNMAKDIQMKNSQHQNIQQYFPSFLWVIRDFTLKIIDKQGNPIQPKQYLQNALQFQKGTSDIVQSKNKIRRMLKHFFKQRDCSTLVRPVQAEQDLQQLSQLSQQSFRPQFIEQINTLRNKIYKKVKCKKMRNKNLTGQLFIELIKSYVQSVNKGSVPNFQLSWKHLITKQIDNAAKQITNKYKSIIEEKIDKVRSTTFIENRQINSFEQLIQKSIKQEIKTIKASNEQDLISISNNLKKQINKCLIQLKQVNKKKAQNSFLNYFYDITNSIKSEKFQTIDSLIQQINKLQNKILQQTKTNPQQNSLFTKSFLTWKSQRIILQASISQRNLKFSINQLTLKNQKLQEQLNQKIKINSEINQNIHQKQKILLISDASHKQDKRVMELEISFLKAQNKNLKEQICKKSDIFDKKNYDLNQQIEIKRNLQRTVDQQVLKIQHLNNQIGFLKRQLQIQKNSLNSKSQQLDELKSQFRQANIELQKCLQRQKVSNSRNKAQIQSKSTQYIQLFNKYDLLQAQHSHLLIKCTRIQTELKNRSQNLEKQKQIYQNMFISFKESITIQKQSRNELIQANKNLSSALKFNQIRLNQAQEKQKSLKQFKRAIKNSSCLQCQHCTKFFVPAIFGQHLNVCILGPQNLIQDQKKNFEENKNYENSQMKIVIKKTLIKQADSKPFTEYTLQITKHFSISKNKWFVQRRYKEFCELNNSLKICLPGVELSEAEYIVNPHQNSKKTVLIQQRRKLLQKYLNDLCRNKIIRKNHIWMKFIGQDEFFQKDDKKNQKYMIDGKQNIKDINSQNQIRQSKRGQTPQQFFKTWNERNLRHKQSSELKKKLKLG